MINCRMAANPSFKTPHNKKSQHTSPVDLRQKYLEMISKNHVWKLNFKTGLVDPPVRFHHLTEIF